ncbi:MAG: CoA-acylating methylmalonate-semialdehyde dehydrogenase [Acidobacteria bacterium]|nr:CoA-acylating methylmalonate-semialdehyde dehydrogenase [Acidobacteriota bacterium]MBV9146633.1 CoA-acylating methylmalonate-semialdehyde dehydrogenase [Acidobacteriota bacterium]
MKSCPIFIDGKARLSRGEVLIQHNPATGEPVAEIPLCTSDEVSAAIASAQAAFPAWSATPVLNRCRVLFHLHTLMEKHADDLMLLIVEENGKTREEARGSFQRGLECVEFASGVSSLMMGETVEHVGTDVDGWSTRHALGVCVGITPFNFPLMVPLWMFPVAIACGNTFVLKPSERVPRSSVRLLELIYEAGLPAGVMNLVHGTKQVVDQLLTDPRVKAVSFVGSSPVAKYIYTTAAANGKRVQALGGAKNHSVVMPDADMKHSANTIMSSSFGCAGERCVATSVVVAVGDAADPLLSALKKAADEMKVGDGSEHGTVMGPIINSEAKKRILNYIDVGQQEGAKLARDGRNDTCCDSEGYFVGPTIFDNVKPSMRIAREEIFGPVLSLVRAKDLGEAIDIVNGSEYGNASSIFTKSGSTAREFSAKVQTGMVGINVGVPAPVAIFPFAGWKGSFFGDLHALGKDGVKFYTETRVVTCRW